MKRVRPDVSLSPRGLWDLLLYFAGFRQAMPVTEVVVFEGGDMYYVCPRCSVTMERELMDCCSRCGQRLGWKDYKKARKIYPGQREAVHT